MDEQRLARGLLDLLGIQSKVALALQQVFEYAERLQGQVKILQIQVEQLQNQLRSKDGH